MERLPPAEPELLLVETGFVPPDPDEPPPVELWSAVGDVAPWGTLALLLAWGALFTWFAAHRAFDDRAALIAWGANMPGAPPLETAWRLLASTFLHAGALHVLMNAASLLIFGPAVERLYTRAGFALAAALGGLGAGGGSLAWRVARGETLSLSVGGSGVVFALGGAVLVAAIRLRKRLAPGRARALGAAMLFLLANAFVGGLTRTGTDNAGHFAGLVAGAALGALLPLSPRLGGARPGIAIRALGALAALAMIAALAAAIARGAFAGV